MGGEVLCLLGPHAGGIDGAGGADVVFPARLTVDHASPGNGAGTIGEVLGDLGAAGGEGTETDRGAHEVDHEACVADPRVMEANGSHQLRRVQRRCQLLRPPASQVLLERNRAPPAGTGHGEGVIQADADGGVHTLVVVLQRPCPA